VGAVPVLAVAAGAAQPADVVGAAAAGYRSVVVSVGSAVSAQVADLAVLARSHLRVDWVPDVRCWPEGVNFRLAERSAVHFHSPADSEWAVHYWPAVVDWLAVVDWPAVVANCPAVR
jgi:hypothetical protein